MALNRQWMPSPNFSGSRARNQLVIVHTSEGSTSQTGLAGFLANPSSGVSYQVCFDDMGNANNIVECVRHNHRAWAAMNANDWGVHGCLCTPSGASGGWSRAVWMSKQTMLTKCARWIAEECARFGIPIRRVDANQIRAGVTGVCGHGDVSAAGAGGSHFDPGPQFPWDHVIALASGGAPPITEEDTDMPPKPDYLNAPVIAMASCDGGYFLFGSDGGVFTFGNAPFLGSLGDKQLNAPIVAADAKRDASGYVMFARDGGVFTFGDMPFLGSLGDKKLNFPVVGGELTHSEQGYWMTASDGGVFTFGDAGFFGSAVP